MDARVDNENSPHPNTLENQDPAFVSSLYNNGKILKYRLEFIWLPSQNGLIWSVALLNFLIVIRI